MIKMRSLLMLLAFVLLLASCGAEELAEEEWEDPGEDEALLLPTADPATALPSPLCSDPQTASITDFQVRKPPSLAEPALHSPFRDPNFGACIVRVSDHGSGPGLKNEYARVGSFNADGSFLLLRDTEAETYLYDAASLRPLGRLPVDTEPRWDAQDPNLLFFSEETRLMSYRISSGVGSLVHDFADDLPASPAAVWTVYEGRPSLDSQTWGLVAEDQEWLPVAFLVYDREEDEVTVRDMRGVPGIEEDVDHVTISPLGTYLLASFDRYCEHGRLGEDAQPCGLMVYDRDLRRGRGLLRIIGHYDTALDAEGREVVVYQDIDQDQIAMLDLASGAITPLWPIDFSHSPIGFHFSGLAYERPGWALVSTYSGGYPAAYTWMDDQVFALELEANGRVVRLAHTHSQVDPDQEHDYWAEPHASVNADFTRILYTSNWGRSGTEEVEAYMIELPADWTERLPN